ncbi:MAG: 16S rRNA (cytidine(1402)-2'-O)-methyltransferase [Methylocystaceae bacterium]
MPGTLYICGTPIGNLEDVTVRLLKTLQQVDIIACEDTRHTVKLLNHYQIKKRLISYHEFSTPEREHYIVQELEAGHNIALVSDAGMPGISDPGQGLISRVIAAGLPLQIIPGPTAFTCGLILSGLDTSTFTFQGFLPSRPRERRLALEKIKQEERTLIFYEAPHRLKATLEDMRNIMGDRLAAVCRELTKLHEEVCRDLLSGLEQHFSEHPPRGEMVIVLSGFVPPAQSAVSIEQATNEVMALVQQGINKKEALKIKASQYGLKKSDLYKSVEENKNND